ncbi:MAG: EI24 domain-containing protein [Candidimonas sp.]
MSDSKRLARSVPRHDATGLAAVGEAFRRALISQCHPRMLALLLMPFLIILLSAVILVWALWSPLTAWLDGVANSWQLMNQVDAWLVSIGLFSLKLYLVPLIALGILLPMSGVLGLVIAAVFVMPIVLRYLEKRDYRGVLRKGEFSTTVGTWNAIWVGTLFAVGWLVTMPLWLIPPMPVLLAWFWWTFAFTRMLRVDALVEHASARERRWLWRRHRRQLWTIGGILSLVNLFPPAWLVLPVFSALVFAHFSLEALRQLRSNTIVDTDGHS